ncbi:MAG: gamma-glutamylcyclotransferase family protein [Leptospira sp.]|nr:gamma-glutamylcyclotransferase family protein [Leptospira sp.]
MIGNLFVYGSLRIGEEAHYLLDDARIIRQNCLIYGYKMYVFEGFPIATKAESDAKIIGDVLNVDNRMFQILDEYEETDTGLYLRTFDETYQFNIYLAGNVTIEPNSNIRNGDWRKR